MTASPRLFPPTLYRPCARILLAAGALFWTWFGLACALWDQMPWTDILLHAAVPGLGLAVLFLVSWKWEFTGAILLLLMSVLVAVFYPLWVIEQPPVTLSFTTVMMTLPPLAAGFLFLLAWSGNRERQ
jgi:hypothetical protein